MAVSGQQERLFDEGHLEILRVLASEASIALENARLFREEQTKSRHLALLNNISRNAISTRNPEEMLVNIAELLDKGLAFDHVGIAHSRLRQQGSGGAGGSGPAPRGSEPASGAGRVLCRTGRTHGPDERGARISVRRPTGVRCSKDSSSGVALPILYADQLLGVLYVETAAPASFSEEDLLLLHTLADLISGRAAQRARVPKGAGASHHRRPDGREDPSLLHGSAFGGVEARRRGQGGRSRWR